MAETQVPLAERLDRFIYIDLRDEGATYLREIGLEWFPKKGRWLDPVSYRYLESITPEEREAFINELIQLVPQEKE